MADSSFTGPIYEAVDENGNPIKSKEDKIGKHKGHLKLIFELNAIGRRITGRDFLKDGRLALKQLKELEELAKDGKRFRFNADRIRAEWTELCNEWGNSDYLQKNGFNLGTIRKRIGNKGL